MNIAQQQIRTQSEDGGLAHAGLTWAQPIAWRERCIEKTLGTAAIAALVTSPIFFVWVSDPGKYTIDVFNFLILATFVLGTLAAVGCVVMPMLDRHWTAQSTGVTFTPDDDIWVTLPRRLSQDYDSWEWTSLRLPASQIASIELAPMKNRAGGHYRHGGDDGYLAYDIWIYFLNGQRFPVGSYLDEEDAHVVVNQLRIALREVQLLAARAA